MEGSGAIQAGARAPAAGALELSAEALAERARSGDVASFEALVARFERPLQHFLFLLTGRSHDAEELAQETFLRAWRNLARFDPERRFATWLFTLARRLAASRARAAPVPTHELVRETPDASRAADPAAALLEQDERMGLWEIAARVLPADQRAALWLRYGVELEIDEIAHALARPRVTVRVHLFRARTALARHLAAREQLLSGVAPARVASPLAGGRP
jgi:RNA polymerase sigma-70 factor (ECF subfamily)